MERGPNRFPTGADHESGSQQGRRLGFGLTFDMGVVDGSISVEREPAGEANFGIQVEALAEALAGRQHFPRHRVLNPLV